MTEDNVGGKVSEFNEASLKMQRIHNSQTMINNLRIDLLGSNFPPKYNYEIFISEVLSLLMETKYKMTPKEIKHASFWRDFLIKMIDSLSIFQEINSDSLKGSHKGRRLNTTNWNLLRKAMFECEDFSREMLEKHGLSSRNADSDEDWD